MRCPSLRMACCGRCCAFIARYNQSRSARAETVQSGPCSAVGEIRMPKSPTGLLEFCDLEADGIERQRDGHLWPAAVLRQSRLDGGTAFTTDDLSERQHKVRVLLIRPAVAGALERH